jgi:hypothetical protein
MKKFLAKPERNTRSKQTRPPEQLTPEKSDNPDHGINRDFFKIQLMPDNSGHPRLSDILYSTLLI